MIKGFDKKKYDRHQVPVILELKEYKAQATRCTGLLFKPGDAKIEKIEK